MGCYLHDTDGMGVEIAENAWFLYVSSEKEFPRRRAHCQDEVDPFGYMS